MALSSGVVHTLNRLYRLGKDNPLARPWQVAGNGQDMKVLSVPHLDDSHSDDQVRRGPGEDWDEDGGGGEGQHSHQEHRLAPELREAIHYSLSLSVLHLVTEVPSDDLRENVAIEEAAEKQTLQRLGPMELLR